jgi:hypothetical protein
MYGIAGLGIIGLSALCIAPFVYFGLYLKERRLKKKIPANIIKEVEDIKNERRKRINGSGTTSGSTELNSSLPVEGDYKQSIEVQRMGNEPVVSDEGRNKPVRFNPI